MPCDTRLRNGQTIRQRITEVEDAVRKVDAGLSAGRVKAKIGPQGAVAFEGINETDRNGASDICIYRRLMVKGSASARLAIARAEQMAGRSVSKQVIGQGVHSHDGGETWHKGH